MKKLLVLLLVFGLASVANAMSVDLSVDGVNASDGTEDIDILSPTITLSVISDDTLGWKMEVSTAQATSTLGFPVATSKAGSIASVTDFSGAGLWDYELNTAGVPGALPQVGEQWTMQLTALGGLGSVFTVNFGEYGQTPVSSIDFTVVPEPMTIALLGLGSLFLLRRRK
jgi:hypothetical protein